MHDQGDQHGAHGSGAAPIPETQTCIAVQSEHRPQSIYTFTEENEVMDLAADDKRDQLLIRCYHMDNWFNIGVWETRNPVKKSGMTKELKEYETEEYYKRYGRNKGFRTRVVKSTNEYNFNSGDIGGYYRQICVDTKRDLIVATFHYKIVLINMEGKQIKKIKSNAKEFPFVDVEGVAYSESQDRYAVTDLTQHCVMLLSAKSHKVKVKFGGPPYLSMPYYVMFMTMGGSERLVVSDTGHHSIKVLNMDGQIQMLFGGMGTGNGDLQIPLGICEGPNESILVCDHDNNRVVAFWTSRGRVFFQVIVNSSELENNRPRFVATVGEQKDHFYVCSLLEEIHPLSQNHTITKFFGLVDMMHRRGWERDVQ